jgi:5'-3' exonuclease
MCLLAGCDYLPNVPGLGIKTAYKLVKQHRTYKKARAWFGAGPAVRPSQGGSIDMLLTPLPAHISLNR